MILALYGYCSFFQKAVKFTHQQQREIGIKNHFSVIDEAGWAEVKYSEEDL